MEYRIALAAEKIEENPSEVLNGVGMIRGEYLCRIIEEYYTLESCREYVKDYIENICKLYEGKEVWYRNSDFIVDEVNVLKGVDHVLKEQNNILGLRGTRRGLKYKDIFKMELEIVVELSKKYNNINILFSYIKDVEELDECIKILKELGVENKYGIMAEIPSVSMDLENFAKRGVSNITIGVNDLTTLMLGTYRGSDYHDCNHPIILKAIKECVEIAKIYNIEVSVGGIVNKRLLDNCKKIGIDYFIINYPLLNKILNVPSDKLKYINQLSEIKKLTKSKRLLEKIKEYKKFIEENDYLLEKGEE